MKKKKLIAFLTCGCLAFTSIFALSNISYGASEYHNYSPDKKGVTNVSSVMRKSASTSSSKILTVPSGKSLPIYGYMEVPGKNWYKVKYNGKTGYIRRDLINVTSGSVSSSSSATNGSTSSTGKYYNYSPDKIGKTTAALNMRKGASNKYSKITTIPKGKSITIYGYMEVPGVNWYKVKYGSHTGYVSREYVKVTGTVAAKSSITGSGIKYPTTLTQGKSFSVTGSLKSTYKITEVKVGIMKVSTGKFYSSFTGIAKPNAKTYSLNKLDSKVPFGKAKPGTYYYTVWAKDEKGNSFTVLKKKFTVKAKSTSVSSTLKIKNASVPKDRYYGAAFPVEGIVSSNYELSNVKVSVVNSSGNTMSGCDESVNPSGKSYDLNKLDDDVKVSKLPKGSYTYKVTAKDSSKTEKTLVKSSFSVKTISTNSQGKTLSYNVSKFRKIGKQPYSGPCGLYAMAYGRLVIDGDFTIRSKYSSVCSQLTSQYGLGSNAAHWNEAGAVSVWTTNAKTAYQAVLNEINSGRPCIIPVNTPRGTNHFVTVIGYTRGTTAANVNLSRLVILDSAYGHQTFGDTHGYSDKSSSSARYIKFNW